MESSVVVNQVIILFLIMLVGFYARKRNIITEDMIGKLSTLLLQITQPLLVISSFNFDFSMEMLKNAALVFGSSLFIHLSAMFMAKFLYSRFPERVRKVLKFITVFSNCGFMGFPVLQSVFGSKGIFYGALYVIPFNILVLSYGVMVFTGKTDRSVLKEIVIHPVTISVAVGMVLFLSQIKLPVQVFRAAEMVGSMTSPLSMLIVGSLLAAIPFRELFKGKEIYAGSFIRLIFLPLVFYGLFRLFRLPEEVLQVSVILSAMPAAANTAIFAEKYGGDAVFSSRVISISTLLSIFTIPLILMIF